MAIPSEAMRRYMDGEIDTGQYFVEIAEETKREVDAELERIKRRARADALSIGETSLSTETAVTKIDS